MVLEVQRMKRGHAEYGYADHVALGAGVLLLLNGAWEGALLALMWLGFHLDRLGLR